jgi:hypothetical protein
MGRHRRNPQRAGNLQTNALQTIIDFEQAAAEKFWKPELEAQQRGQNVEALWDEINHSSNKLAAFAAAFKPAEITIQTSRNHNSAV